MSTSDSPGAGGGLRRVLVLVNPKSGVAWSFNAVRAAFDRHWEKPGVDLSFQFCQGVEDGVAKARRAVDAGFDTVLAVGGDGTISTIGRTLVGSGVNLGAIPAGSGNGFARHFSIPLNPMRAVEALAGATPRTIDVGRVDGTPFLVTCSMAWDASLVRSFQKLPVRGILPYILAGAMELFEYRPQSIDVTLDSGEDLHFEDPFVFTVANLTQYGGGAIVAPNAEPDDGFLELVVLLKKDVPMLVANLARIFDGSIHDLPEIKSRRFRSMKVRRKRPAPIQMDGELIDAPAELEVAVDAGSLHVLVPEVPAN